MEGIVIMEGTKVGIGSGERKSKIYEIDCLEERKVEKQ